MERMLVVVFEDESEAYEGTKALRQLDLEGSITVYAHAVVVKNPDGAVIARERDDQGPFGLLVGTALGALIGVLGGLTGIGIGGTVGLAAGGALDLHNARVGEDFIDDVTKALSPGRAAVIAEIEEEATGPVDAQMGAIGGTVFRRALSEVEHAVHEEHLAAMKADLAQMKAEHAQAHVERRIKLQEKINQLESSLQAQLEKAKERREAAELEARAKVELLQKKAAAAKARAAAKAKAGDYPVSHSRSFREGR